MKKIVSGIKNIILFILGLLAIIFSSITILWILYNFVNGNMHPVVKEKLDDNIFWSGLHVIGIFSINLIIFSTGKKWISESGIVSAFKK